MLTDEMIMNVKSQAQEYWLSEVKKNEIKAIAQGKEIGHKLADLVDEKTVALLQLKYITRFQRDAKGQKRSRSMGDVWLLENEIYHPINVKTGVVGLEGQPNLVSLKKILTAIINRQIDSYYLLVVKMRIDNNLIEPSIHFVDMLDCLDYITFDAGPGQLMLKASRFFSEYQAQAKNNKSIQQKVQRLMELYEDGEQRLRINRDQDLQKYRKEYESFLNDETFIVTSDTQKGLNLR